MGALPELRDKIAVVTGGASGIGKGIATQLAAAGMRVVIADIEDKALQGTAAEIGAVGVRTDVSDLASVQALAKTVCDRFGTVHVLCNNAGVGPMANLSDVTIEDWRWRIRKWVSARSAPARSAPTSGTAAAIVRRRSVAGSCSMSTSNAPTSARASDGWSRRKSANWS
jgi:NAD(P)-dependent dehydrogenase (short-subunit alcohol dehydrogenase family)